MQSSAAIFQLHNKRQIIQEYYNQLNIRVKPCFQVQSKWFMQRNAGCQAVSAPISKNLSGFFERIKECNTGTQQKSGLFKFRIEDENVGFMLPKFADILSEFSDVFQIDQQERMVLLNPALNTSEDRTNSVQKVNQELRARGLLNAWRGEFYPVSLSYSHPPKMLIERGATSAYGTLSYGIHVNGYTYLGEGSQRKLHMWVAKRSRDKPTWPGKLDHIVAGGQPHDLTTLENVIKECDEEASIPRELAELAIPTGWVSCETMRTDGIKRDVLFIYDIELPSDFVPKPNDDEVEGFELHPIEKVEQIVLDTQDFKENCTLVIIDFLIRHGHITPHHERYLELSSALRSFTF